MVEFASTPLPTVRSEAEFFAFVRELDGKLDAISQASIRTRMPGKAVASGSPQMTTNY